MSNVPPPQAPTLSQTLNAGAVRYVTSLRGLQQIHGWSDAQLVGRIQQQFNVSQTTAQQILARGDRALSSGEDLRISFPWEQLRAREVQSREAGCTRWRYHVVVSFQPQNGPPDDSLVTLTYSSSQSRRQVESAAQLLLLSSAAPPSPNSNPLAGQGQQIQITGVSIASVERWC